VCMLRMGIVVVLRATPYGYLIDGSCAQRAADSRQRAADSGQRTADGDMSGRTGELGRRDRLAA